METAKTTNTHCTESAIVVVTTATRETKEKRGMQCSCPLKQEEQNNQREKTRPEGTTKKTKRQERSKTKNKTKQEQGGRVALKLNSCMHTRVMVSATAHMQAKARKTFTDQKINTTKPHVYATLRHLLNRSRWRNTSRACMSSAATSPHGYITHTHTHKKQLQCHIYATMSARSTSCITYALAPIGQQINKRRVKRINISRHTHEQKETFSSSSRRIECTGS